MSDNAEHGGHRALLGFYYQMLATLGAIAVGLDNSDDPTSFLAKFKTDQDTQFLPECLGQDLMISAGEHICLVQYKHSGSYYGGKIGKPEIWEVINSFRKSVIKAESESIPRRNISACVLITNRKLVGIALTVQDWALKCRKECAGDSSMVSVVSVNIVKLRQVLDKPNGKPIAEIIREIIENEFANIADRQKAKRDLNKAVDITLFVLARLFIRTEMDAGKFETKIQQFAQQHGATEADVDAVTAAILGKILQHSLTKSPLTVMDFLMCLTGSREAIPLTPEGIGPACIVSWASWKKAQGAGATKIFPRDHSGILDKLLRHKIVFITGEGGVGKTELLVALTESIAEAAKTSQTFQGFPVLVQSLKLQAEWLEHEIERWAKRPVISLKNVDKLLRTANQNAPRILLLCIDGLDEHEPYASIIQHLYQMALDDDGVRLLITSRPVAAREIVRRIFAGNATASGHFSYTNMSVEVNIFRPEELQQAIGDTFEHELDDLFGNRGGFGLQSSILPSSFVDPTVLESLRHPRMFGAFATLTNDLDAARRFLEGRPHAVKQVARVFLKRFFEKYAQRHTDLLVAQFRLKWHAEVYKDIAVNTRGAGKQNRDRWHQIVRAKTRPRQIDEDRLFLEATTGGLIIEAEDEWYWRHAFVADCLAEDAVDSYLEG